MLGKLIEYGYYWDKLISIENIISPAIFITIAFRYLYLVNVDIYILMSKYVVCYKASKTVVCSSTKREIAVNICFITSCMLDYFCIITHLWLLLILKFIKLLINIFK
ncbi:hypothetical protein EB796_002306 [Bugula neritina]|uniref:Uncharacterized protein n=1 Tax=Bugula neritina TaxID=10212 RepID=A0A7J7KML4_BUGNE|nr:hypothetical protein EB796_002306 [Bugula neritina]